MGFFATLVKGGGGTTKKTTTPVKVPSVATVTGVAAAIVKGATKAATNLSKSYQKPKSKNNGGGGSSGSGQQQQQQQQQTPSADDEATKSGDLIRWSGGGTISFFVKPKAIQGMKEISITAAPETEDKENGDEKVTSLKKKGKIKITMTGIMMAALGADVEGMSLRAMEAARKGDTGYLYLAGKKMFTPQFMMTKADIKNILFGLDGKWIQSEVSMELSQCSKYDGSTNPPSGGSGFKYSVTVYYSGSSGAISSVTGYSNVSKEDARKKAWAKVPSNAQWASETKPQATNQTTGRKDTVAGANGATTVKTQNNAKKTSQQVYNNSKRPVALAK